MPVCWKCGRVTSSAELRKTKKGHLCKDGCPDPNRPKTKPKGKPLAGLDR